MSTLHQCGLKLEIISSISLRITEESPRDYVGIHLCRIPGTQTSAGKLLRYLSCFSEIVMNRLSFIVVLYKPCGKHSAFVY